MRPLQVCMVQGETRWHDSSANREYYGSLVRKHANAADLVLLPETFLSGFTNETAGQAEPMNGEAVRWMRALAVEIGAVMCGSLVICEGDQHLNRMLWMRPDGSHSSYDKRHLFRMADEHQRYAAGTGRVVVELNGWRVLLQVCYDLRFPVWVRNRRDESAESGMDYDLAVFVANWPASRRHAWRTLLRARAIENLACCIGVNRVGVDGNDVAYAGDSAAIDFSGATLIEFGAQEQVGSIVLDPAPLQEFRRRFPAWMDADEFFLSG